MLIAKNSRGQKGEEFATSYLQKRGFKILERNYRIRNGEIDIIAIDKKEYALVFVEVKTRSSEQFGTPFEAIHYFKMKALLNAAQVYKATHPKLPDLLRIDAIAVSIDREGNVTNVEHMKNTST